MNTKAITPPQDAKPTILDKHGNELTIDELAWWSDLNGTHRPRMVTITQINVEEGLAYCRDDTGNHYMTVPEELIKNEEH